MNTLTKQWVDALRSGEYQQAENRLRTFDDRYCCLGVLCDLVDKTGWEGHIGELSGIKYHKFSYHGSFSQTTLPGDMNKLVELNPDQIGYLMSMNDHGASFEDIATVIASGDVPKEEEIE